MLIGVVGWVILGIIVGFIVSKVVNLRGDGPGIGIGLAAIGAAIGGSLYNLFSGNAVTPFNPRSLLFAGIAAVAALVVFHGWRRKLAS